jgi:hypothetical protein
MDTTVEVLLQEAVFAVGLERRFRCELGRLRVLLP